MILCVRKYNVASVLTKTLRTSFIDKLNAKNTFFCAKGVAASVYIEMKNLEDFDSVRLIAAHFILYLLTGCRPYVARFGLFQTFKEKEYDVVVRVDVRKQALLRLIEALSYEIFPFIAKADCTSQINIVKKGIVVGFTISDLSFIRVVETHSIFFKWHDRIKINFSFFNATVDFVDVYFSSFKINWKQFWGTKFIK